MIWVFVWVFTSLFDIRRSAFDILFVGWWCLGEISKIPFCWASSLDSRAGGFGSLVNFENLGAFAWKIFWFVHGYYHPPRDQ